MADSQDKSYYLGRKIAVGGVGSEFNTGVGLDGHIGSGGGSGSVYDTAGNLTHVTAVGAATGSSSSGEGGTLERQSLDSLRPILTHQKEQHQHHQPHIYRTHQECTQAAPVSDTIMIDDVMSTIYSSTQKHKKSSAPGYCGVTNNKPVFIPDKEQQMHRELTTEDVYTLRFSTSSAPYVVESTKTLPRHQHSPNPARDNYIYGCNSLKRAGFEIISHADVRPATPIKFEQVKELNGFEQTTTTTTTTSRFKMAPPPPPPPAPPPPPPVPPIKWANEQSFIDSGERVEWQMAHELRTTDWDRLKQITADAKCKPTAMDNDDDHDIRYTSGRASLLYQKIDDDSLYNLTRRQLADLNRHQLGEQSNNNNNKHDTKTKTLLDFNLLDYKCFSSTSSLSSKSSFNSHSNSNCSSNSSSYDKIIKKFQSKKINKRDFSSDIYQNYHLRHADYHSDKHARRVRQRRRRRSDRSTGDHCDARDDGRPGDGGGGQRAIVAATRDRTHHSHHHLVGNYTFDENAQATTHQMQPVASFSPSSLTLPQPQQSQSSPEQPVTLTKITKLILDRDTNEILARKNLNTVNSDPNSNHISVIDVRYNNTNSNEGEPDEAKHDLYLRKLPPAPDQFNQQQISPDEDASRRSSIISFVNRPSKKDPGGIEEEFKSNNEIQLKLDSISVNTLNQQFKRLDKLDSDEKRNFSDLNRDFLDQKQPAATNDSLPLPPGPAPPPPPLILPTNQATKHTYEDILNQIENFSLKTLKHRNETEAAAAAIKTYNFQEPVGSLKKPLQNNTKDDRVSLKSSTILSTNSAHLY